MKKLLTSLFLLILTSSLITGCMQQRRSLGDQRALLNSDGNDDSNPFTSSAKNQLGDLFSDLGSSNNLGSISTDGTISDSDAEVLTNVIEELEEVNPQEEDDIPPELMNAIKNVLNKEQQGGANAQTSAQKMMLASQLIKKCMSSVAEYAPQPGETLQGSWKTSCKNKGHDKSFTINGIFQKKYNKSSRSTSSTKNRGFARGLGLGRAKFEVIVHDKAKPTKGQLKVRSNGVASFQAGDYQGALTDLPSAATGFLYKGSTKCKANLISSASDVQKKYRQGMKKAGQCYRKGLLLFSPVFDNVFQGMDPQLAQLLKVKLLGIK